MAQLNRRRRSACSTVLAAVLGTVVAGCALLLAAAPAAASSSQLSVFEVPNIQAGNPSMTLRILRTLGVDVLRVPVIWGSIAPEPSSRARPNFNAADPAAYPSASWAPYDAVVSQAIADGIEVDLMPTGGAPLWATAPGAPRCSTVAGTVPVCFDSDFFPSATEYGQFVRAVAARYRQVHFWELWNEANWGPSLTPQYDGSSLPTSAQIYRGLINAGWSALAQTGHRRDTIVASSLSQDGSAHPRQTGTSPPLTFIRTLFCLSASYRQLRGAAARKAGCPVSKSGARRFRAANPALFAVSGIGIHPYPYGRAPTHIDYPSRNGAEFAELPHLVSAVDRVRSVYGSRTRMRIYNTEYGYQVGFATAQNAAKYINWAEYLSWKDPRITSYDQFELWDVTWFPTGLLRADGAPKPSFYAYRLPVWMPVTRSRRGRKLEVWGDARAAHFATSDGYRPQYVSIQWRRGAKAAFTTIERVRLRNPRGYFDVRVKFPASGQVRLAWAYPSTDMILRDPLDTAQWIYSRVTSISITR